MPSSKHLRIFIDGRSMLRVGVSVSACRRLVVVVDRALKKRNDINFVSINYDPQSAAIYRAARSLFFHFPPVVVFVSSLFHSFYSIHSLVSPPVLFLFFFSSFLLALLSMFSVNMFTRLQHTYTLTR